jgi:hypothetical protein
MIFIEMPVLVVALVPVVALEAAVYRWRLSVPGRDALWSALQANLWSTFVGVPLAWLAQLLGQTVVGGGGAWGLDTPLLRLAAVTVQSAWLVPYRGEEHWMVPAAALCLLAPCLLVSVGVEQWRLRRQWAKTPAAQVVRATILANVASYLLLAAYWSAQLFSARPAAP